MARGGASPGARGGVGTAPGGFVSPISAPRPIDYRSRTPVDPGPYGPAAYGAKYVDRPADITLVDSRSGNATSTVITVTLPSYLTTDYIVLFIASNNGNAQTYQANVTATNLANTGDRVAAYHIAPTDGAQTSFTVTVGTSSVFSWWIGTYRGVDAGTVYAASNAQGSSTSSTLAIPPVTIGYIATGFELALWCGGVNATATWTTDGNTIYSSPAANNAAMMVSGRTLLPKAEAYAPASLDRGLNGTARNQNSVALILPAFATATPNLLANPSFENGTTLATSWQDEHTTVGAATYSLSTTGLTDGAKSQTMAYTGQGTDTGTGIIEIFQSPITGVSPGDLLEFDVWLSGSLTNCYCFIGIEGFSTGQVYISEADTNVLTLSGTATKYTVQYTCPPGTVSVAAYLQVPSIGPTVAFSINLDQSSLVKVTPASASAVGAQLDLRWSVRAAAGKSSDQRWAVQAAAGQQRDLRWSVATTTGTSSDLRWSVRGLAGASSDQRWAIRAPAGKSSDLRWSVATTTGKAVDVRWAVRTAVGTQDDVRWSVLAAVGKASDTRWSVRALAGRSSDQRWAVRTLIAHDIDLRWQVVGVAGVVGQQLELRWAARVTTGASSDLRWRVSFLVGAARDVRWAARSLTARDLDTRWAARVIAAATFDARWAVRVPVRQDVTLRWALLAAAAATADLRWSLLAATGDDLDLRWRILVPHVRADPSRLVVVMVSDHRQAATIPPGRTAVAANGGRATATVDDLRVAVSAGDHRVVPSA